MRTEISLLLMFLQIKLTVAGDISLQSTTVLYIILKTVRTEIKVKQLVRYIPEQTRTNFFRDTADKMAVRVRLLPLTLHSHTQPPVKNRNILPKNIILQ